jgi:heat shock protein HslJ
MISEMKRVAREGTAALALILAGCTSASGPKSEVVGPVWGAVSIADKAVLDDALITLQLDGDGRATGKGGCNGYGGSYSLDDRSLRFGPIAATKMACETEVMDQEQAYFDLLAQVERYAVGDDGALALMTADGKEIRFLRE